MRNSGEQIVKTLIRGLIWVCTVCLCPKNGTLCLYGLKAFINDSKGTENFEIIGLVVLSTQLHQEMH